MTHWREIAADAESLLDQPVLNPARVRAVISRSYYAAYHACLEHAGKAGYVRQQGAGGVHKQLLGFMTRRPGSVAYSLGKQLERLRNRRVDADYHLNARLARRDAEEALDIMTDILSSLPASKT